MFRELTDAEILVCNFTRKFVDENWHRIDLKRCEITQSKEDFLIEVTNDPQTAMWVITEVATWGMDKRDSLKEIECDTKDCEFNVIKIEDKYVKWIWVTTPKYEFQLSLTEPKTKTIIYFE